jgi:hypothetical protein
MNKTAETTVPDSDDLACWARPGVGASPFIMLIKRLRETRGLGLLDAKVLVEAWQQSGALPFRTDVPAVPTHVQLLTGHQVLCKLVSNTAKRRDVIRIGCDDLLSGVWSAYHLKCASKACIGREPTVGEIAAVRAFFESL